MHDIPHFVFEPTAPAIPLWRLIWPLILRVRNFDLRSAIKGWGRPRLLYFQLKKIFLLASLDYLQPRIVITFIDNSGVFHVLASEYHGAKFIAIQNGGRTTWCMTDALPPAPHPASRINIPIYYCFGQWEIDLHRKYGHTIGSAIPVGSLVGGRYWFRERAAMMKPDFEICLVSQWMPHFFPINNDFGDNVRPEIPLFAEGIERLVEFVSRYASDRNVDIVVAPRSTNPAERVFYEHHLGAHLTYIDHDRENFSSYRTIDRAKVVVAMNSTLSHEAFGVGKKVLFCNLSGSDHYTCPVSGPWALGKVPYEAFRDRLDDIRRTEPVEFRRISSATARYFMNYDSLRPAHEVIRDDIKTLLSAA